MPSARRFPPPWTFDEANDACFIVRDSTEQPLAGRRSVGGLDREPGWIGSPLAVEPARGR